MRRAPSPPVRTSGRFFASASQFGFTPPPVAVKVKLVPGPFHWALFIQPSAPSSLGSLVEWLEPWSPLRLEFGSRAVLRADFDPLPPAWSARFRTVDLDMLRLLPNGDAVASVTGPRPALAAFARLMETPGVPLDVREITDSPQHARLLTKAQDEALREAVTAGYYRIPRPLNLHQLADRMGISCASLSERLRRAEGRVIMRYVNEGGRSPWDDRTLYEAHPPEGDDAPQPLNDEVEVRGSS